MSAKHHFQRHLYAAIRALLHFLLIRMFGESMTSGLVKVVQSFAKLRKNQRDSHNS